LPQKYKKIKSKYLGVSDFKISCVLGVFCIFAGLIRFYFFIGFNHY